MKPEMAHQTFGLTLGMMLLPACLPAPLFQWEIRVLAEFFRKAHYNKSNVAWNCRRIKYLNYYDCKLACMVFLE